MTLISAGTQITSLLSTDKIPVARQGSTDPFYVSPPVFFKGITNVTLNGLVGDGVTDNLSAINTIISAASDGDIIYFPKGTYLFSGKIAVTKSLFFKGDGMDQSILTLTANATLLEVSGSTADGFRMRDIGLVGNATGGSQKGFVGTGTLGRYYIEFCKAINFGADGFSLSGTATSPYWNTTIINSYATTNAGIGIRTTGQYITVLNCSSQANTSQDLQVENANCRIIGGTYQKIKAIANTDNGKLQFIGLACNHGVVAFDGSNLAGGIISPIEWKSEAAASSFSVIRCKNVEINGYVPGLVITDLLAGSFVNVHHCTISGGWNITSNNATSRINFDHNFFATAGPTGTLSGSGQLSQDNNWDSAGNTVTIS
jgi:hypothetical protein